MYHEELLLQDVYKIFTVDKVIGAIIKQVCIYAACLGREREKTQMSCLGTNCFRGPEKPGTVGCTQERSSLGFANDARPYQ